MFAKYLLRWEDEDGKLHELPTAQVTEDYPTYSVGCWYDSEEELENDLQNWVDYGGRVDGEVVVLKSYHV